MGYIGFAIITLLAGMRLGGEGIGLLDDRGVDLGVVGADAGHQRRELRRACRGAGAQTLRGPGQARLPAA